MTSHKHSDRNFWEAEVSMVGISVLTSVFKSNSGDEVARCLESLERQTRKADEVVIVLDGPVASGVQQMVIRYSQSLNVKVVTIHTNVGLGAALNVGLKHCTQDLVARIDIDDVCKPDRLRLQYEYLTHHPEVVVLGGQVELFDGRGIYGVRSVPVEPEAIRRYARLRNPLNHSTVMFRKERITRIGGYPAVRFTQDYLLWVKCLANDYVIHNLSVVLSEMFADKEMIGRRDLRFYRYDIMPYVQNYRLGNNGLMFLALAVSVRYIFNAWNSGRYVLHKLIR